MGPSERSGSTVTSSETTAGRVVALAKVTATLGEFDHTPDSIHDVKLDFRPLTMNANLGVEVRA